MNKIMSKTLTKIGDMDLLEKIISLPKSEFNSLMLEIFKKQTEEIGPKDILKAYEKNRFVKPSEIDFMAYSLFEYNALRIAKSLDFENILLSPSAPLGSCSAFGCVNQYNVLSAVRGTETLADPSNMLAIIIADKIKNKNIAQDITHTVTTTRVVRAQPIPDIKGFYAHFGVLCMVSHGKDVGSYMCETNLISKHLEYVKKLLMEQEQSSLEISVVFRKRKGYKDSDGLLKKISEFMELQFPDMNTIFDYSDSDNNYYKGVNYKIYIIKDGEKIELCDGGFVDWISQMTGSKKERCLITGIGIDRFIV